MLAMLGLLAIGAPVSAQVVSADDPRFGPGSITIDMATGYHWLDLSFTRGRLIEEVLSELGPGGDFEGFRYATQAEVVAFWQSAGLTISFGNPPAPYVAFMALTGGPTGIGIPGFNERSRQRPVGRPST